jgi:hypothetical protein
MLEALETPHRERSATVFDLNKATTMLNQRAPGRKPGQKCATFVRIAIAGGGVTVQNTYHAKDYGPQLEKAGFRKVTDGTLQKGDVAVIQNYPGGNISGHMTMYDGQKWVSDYQQRDMWGGDGYRTHQPAHQIYRHPDAKGQLNQNPAKGKGSGSGVQGITTQGKKLKNGASHGVVIGPKKRHFSHKRADLEGGGMVTQGSGSVFVGREQYAVARVNDATTHGQIVIGEDTILVG